MSILLDFFINMLYFKIKILENSIFGKFSFYREIKILTIFILFSKIRGQGNYDD